MRFVNMATEANAERLWRNVEDAIEREGADHDANALTQLVSTALLQQYALLANRRPMKADAAKQFRVSPESLIVDQLGVLAHVVDRLPGLLHVLKAWIIRYLRISTFEWYERGILCLLGAKHDPECIFGAVPMALVGHIVRSTEHTDLCSPALRQAQDDMLRNPKFADLLAMWTGDGLSDDLGGPQVSAFRAQIQDHKPTTFATVLAAWLRYGIGGAPLQEWVLDRVVPALLAKESRTFDRP